jgi:tRNA-dihydrouridine synthase B
MTKPFEIYLAPLQGFTDFAFCAAHQQFIGGVDRYFTPYVVLENDGTIKNKYRKELNRFAALEQVVPQVLPATVDELHQLMDFLMEFGFSRVNINAGCPYPMVMNRGRGAALLAKPELLAQMVNVVRDEYKLEVGIKTRLGIEEWDQARTLVSVLKASDLSELTIHARTARQMYKGEVRPDIFRELADDFPGFRWVYNGDIDSVQRFRELQEFMPEVSAFMIGRGLLMDPLLSLRLTRANDDPSLNALSIKILQEFMLHYFDLIVETSNDAKHAMNRVVVASEYFTHSYIDGNKLRKSLKKSKSLDDMRFSLQKFDLKSRNQF